MACRKPSRSPRAESRESVGKSTVVIATAKTPCGSMYTRKDFWIAVGASTPFTSREAKTWSITALTLIRPRPSVTGTMSTNVRLTIGSRQSISTRSRSSPCSSERSHG